jgi:hypothetical protein
MILKQTQVKEVLRPKENDKEYFFVFKKENKKKTIS